LSRRVRIQNDEKMGLKKNNYRDGGKKGKEGNEMVWACNATGR
jgi:hypothetical protein